ncbi:hypothetical protein H9Q74_013470 [Fusarium xylarioides]|nr:hypothetical protein H9Q71_013360 [Fusarium xylarioides]KAG5811716.1 hypothetical protein H9Q74_013470 [Fusarium xylarioides]
MSTIVTVMGATGVQGSSVINAFTASKDAKRYSLRAITRNTTSEAAQKLSAAGIQVVQADTNDVESLRAAFSGSHVIYSTTNFFEVFQKELSVEEAGENEITQGVNIAKAAAMTSSLQHFIWSTLPNARGLMRGNKGVPFQDSKNEVEDYIKSDVNLFSKTTFLMIGFYLSNIQYPFFQPFSLPTSGTSRLMQILPCPSTTLLPVAGDEQINIGLFVKAIVSQPEKTLGGKYVQGAVGYMSVANFVATWAAKENRTVECIQVTPEAYNAFWPGYGQLMAQAFEFWGLLKDKSFSVNGSALTHEDLNISGLVDVMEGFA